MKREEDQSREDEEEHRRKKEEQRREEEEERRRREDEEELRRRLPRGLGTIGGQMNCYGGVAIHIPVGGTAEEALLFAPD